jgi:hypothetical protein
VAVGIGKARPRRRAGIVRHQQDQHCYEGYQQYS